MLREFQICPHLFGCGAERQSAPARPRLVSMATPDDDAECGICLGPIKAAAASGSCSHSFCAPCLLKVPVLSPSPPPLLRLSSHTTPPNRCLQWCATSENEVCPMCRTPIRGINLTEPAESVSQVDTAAALLAKHMVLIDLSVPGTCAGMTLCDDSIGVRVPRPAHNLSFCKLHSPRGPSSGYGPVVWAGARIAGGARFRSRPGLQGGAAYGRRDRQRQWLDGDRPQGALPPFYQRVHIIRTCSGRAADTRENIFPSRAAHRIVWRSSRAR